MKMYPLLRLYLLLVPAVALGSLCAVALAVSPPPDGGYPNGNTAEGDNALFSLTTGVSNTAIGFEALLSNTTGSFNTANGESALFNNTEGFYNTATGSETLYSNTTGAANTANGYQALFSNTGGNNTASGSQALYSNTTGVANTATGTQALFSNATGGNNTAAGVSALTGNTNGSFNTAIGLAALANNTTGSSNIALGLSAGSHLTTGSNNIDIGNVGVAGESAKIRIGSKPAQKATFIAGISGVTVANGVGVIINTQGQLGTVVSSARFKDDVKPMAKSSEAVLSLKPVTFRYKKDLDPQGIPQFGLVAEEVAKVNPDLVARDDKGKPYTVRYEAVNAMLLNEFLKEHRKVEALEAERKLSAARQERLEEQAAQQEVELRNLKSAVATLARGDSAGSR